MASLTSLIEITRRNEGHRACRCLALLESVIKAKPLAIIFTISIDDNIVYVVSHDCVAFSLRFRFALRRLRHQWFGREGGEKGAIAGISLIPSAASSLSSASLTSILYKAWPS